MIRRLTPSALAIPVVLALWSLASPALAAPDAPESDDDSVAGAAATPPADAPATRPSTDAPAGPPADAPATRPSTDAPAGPPSSGDAPATLPRPEIPPADTEPAPEGPTDPNREASSKEAGTAISGETETVGEVESERVGKKEKKEKSLSHYQTGGVTVSGGWGFYGVVPYTDGMYCGEYSSDVDSDSGRKSFCTNTRGVAFMEFGGMYGAHPRLDIVVNFRLNMMKRKFVCEDDNDCEGKGLFNDSLGFGLFPGIRGWISKPEDLFKIGAAIDFMWMHENFDGYRKRPLCLQPSSGPAPGDPVCPRPIDEPAKVPEEDDIKDNDVGVRIGLALQIDPHHNIGIFVMPTARMGFLRWFEFAVDVQLGIQARFP